MNSSWILLIVQSLLILMSSTNARSTGMTNLDDYEWDGLSVSGEEPPEVPETLVEEEVFESDEEISHSTARSARRRPSVTPSKHKPRAGDTDGFPPPFPPPSSSSHSLNDLTAAIQHDVEQSQYDTTFYRQIPSYHPSLPEYHLKNPTDVVVQFAQLRKEIRMKMQAMQVRSNVTDTHVTDLINISISDIRRNTEKNNELINSETQKRVAALRRVRRFAKDKIRFVEEKMAGVDSNLQKLEQSTDSNKFEFESYETATNQRIEDLKNQITRLFEVVIELQKHKYDKL